MSLKGAVYYGLHVGTLRFDITLHPSLRGCGMYAACLERTILQYENDGHSVTRIPALMNIDESLTCKKIFEDLNSKLAAKSRDLISDVENIGSLKNGNAVALREMIIEAVKGSSIYHVRRACGFGRLDRITIITDTSGDNEPNHGVYLEFSRGEPLADADVKVLVLAGLGDNGDRISFSERVTVNGLERTYPILPSNSGTANMICSYGSVSSIPKIDILGVYGLINVPMQSRHVAEALAGENADS